MRCPSKGGQIQALRQAAPLLLWLLLHSASCLVLSVTSAAERPRPSITIRPTLTTGPRVSPDRPPSDFTQLHASVAADAGVPYPGSHGNHGGTDAGKQRREVTGEEDDSVFDSGSGSGRLLTSFPAVTSMFAEPQSSHLLSLPQSSLSPSLPQSSYPLSLPQSSPSDTPSLPHPPPSVLQSPHPPSLPLSASPTWPPPAASVAPPVGGVAPCPSAHQGNAGSTCVPTSHLEPTAEAAGDSLQVRPFPAASVSHVTATWRLKSPLVGAMTSAPPYARVTTGDLNVTAAGGEMRNVTAGLPPGGGGGGVTVGVTVGVSVACVLVIASGVLVGLALLYHRHRSRKMDTTKPPSNHYTGLWDDNVTLSYINNHFDFFQKDAQDEMISLDNDAYLNSLEFMVFTNTWGDGKRNTRF